MREIPQSLGMSFMFASTRHMKGARKYTTQLPLLPWWISRQIRHMSSWWQQWEKGKEELDHHLLRLMRQLCHRVRCYAKCLSWKWISILERICLSIILLRDMHNKATTKGKKLCFIHLQILSPKYSQSHSVAVYTLRENIKQQIFFTLKTYNLIPCVNYLTQTGFDF